MEKICQLRRDFFPASQSSSNKLKLRQLKAPKSRVRSPCKKLKQTFVSKFDVKEQIFISGIVRQSQMVK